MKDLKAEERIAQWAADMALCWLLVGTTRRNQMLELHFDADQGSFLGQPAGSETTSTFAPQGLSKPDLMGELGHLLALSAYQLALPFTHEAWRQLEYTRVLSGTTF